MTDIVDWLRHTAGHLINGTAEDGTVEAIKLCQAADTIEQYRADAAYDECTINFLKGDKRSEVHTECCRGSAPSSECRCEIERKAAGHPPYQRTADVAQAGPDWFEVAGKLGARGMAAEAALEQIAIVCTDNMDRDCDHRMALSFVRQIANDALEASSLPPADRETVKSRTDREGGWNAERGLLLPSTHRGSES